MNIVSLDKSQIVLKGWMMADLKPNPFIQNIADSISKRSLLNPLTVRVSGSKYEIVDGIKRFKAIKALTRKNSLPRTLHKIPCLVQRDMAGVSNTPAKPLLLSDSQLAADILTEFDNGMSIHALSEAFYCSADTVMKVLSLKTLHRDIFSCFARDLLSLNQAAAFATIPNKAAQWRLLQQLGPFAKSAEIIDAIEKGETVVTLPDGQTLILPSRGTRPKTRKPKTRIYKSKTEPKVDIPIPHDIAMAA